MKLRTFIAGAASAAIMSPLVASAQMTSLEEVVERAILTHPEVRARFQDFQSTLEGQNVVRGGLLPEVTAQGWTGNGAAVVPVKGVRAAGTGTVTVCN